ncbi:IS3 family transposase [Corynebacterium stercoris]|uniref:IS3 family transposase n=1 Tax=Corynebacterium stercoris TaxID=2943490 RepID=UPI0034619792
MSDLTHTSKGCTACQEGTCLKRWRYIPSLSREGNSGDNARVEGFFGTPKQERIHGRDATRRLTRAEMTHYIEDYIDFYINHRLKSTLGNGYTTIAQQR